VDRDFGLIHIRLQTWLPFPIQVCLNGREYLARQLTKAGIGYEQRDNCFVRIDDLPRAQAILDRLVKRKWPRWLRVLGRRHNPLVNAVSGLRLHDYYWTVRQGEWASDVMFTDAAALREVYPTLVQHAIMQFDAQHVLRFLGRRTNARFNGEVRSDLKHRPEGICVKHWVEENSIKMYDKHGSILRIETTINNPRRFAVRRGVTRKGQRCTAWVPMRKSVADIPRLVQVSQAANQRYLQALALVSPPQPAHRVLDPVSRRIIKEGRPYRALRPISPEEAAWFRLLLSGAFRIQGFRKQTVGEGIIHHEVRHRQQFRIAGPLDAITLQRAQIVRVSELGAQLLENFPIAPCAGFAHFIREVAFQIFRHAIIVEQRVVDVEKEHGARVGSSLLHAISIKRGPIMPEITTRRRSTVHPGFLRFLYT